MDMQELIKRLRCVKNSCCEECGERIPLPVFRSGQRIICTDCYGDKPHTVYYVRDPRSDSRYHGGRFHAGEW